MKTLDAVLANAESFSKGLPEHFSGTVFYLGNVIEKERGS